MLSMEMSDNFVTLNEKPEARQILEKFERSKILEIYFSRLDGRVATLNSSEFSELYEIELSTIKSFLLGQHPKDTLLQKIFCIMN